MCVCYIDSVFCEVLFTVYVLIIQGFFGFVNQTKKAPSVSRVIVRPPLNHN